MQNERQIEDLIEELRALRVRETVIIEQIEAANRVRTRRTGQHTINRQPVAVNAIREGDRVRITNKVRKPATAGPSWTEHQERVATVTRVTAEQIHIVTDNGTRTWRAPNNLRKQELALQAVSLPTPS